jgi:antitoxin (DNA-binding transcriptional repressor) of toxin-antitoxin stability system
MKKYLSTKQLREEFPEVRDGLKRGNSYVLLYRSKPLAEIRPFDEKEETSQDQKKESIEKDLVLIDRIAGSASLGGLTPKQINEMIDESYE